MRHPEYESALEALKACQSETVPAAMLAPIVNMNAGVIIKYAKEGKWNLCKYVISGDRVKFFRRDFLQNCGLMDPDTEEPTDHQLAIAMVDALTAILEGQKMLLQLLDEQNDLLHAMSDPFYRLKKTAGAATPTD
jgi:hypothetical protein